MTGALVEIAPVTAVLALAFDFSGAIALATLAIWLWPRRGRMGNCGTPMVVALLLTSGFCVALAAGEPRSVASSFAESARNLGWFWVIYTLFAASPQTVGIAPVRAVVFSLAFVELLHFGVDLSLFRLGSDEGAIPFVFDFDILFRLLVTVGGLMLVHNLYASTPRPARGGLRWPVMALATLWLFDLNLYSVAYLTGSWPVELGAMRGLAGIAMAGLIAIGASRDRAALRLMPSRTVTLQTVSLLIIAIYITAMIGVGQWLSYAGGTFSRLIELAFLTLASAIALTVLPSQRLRGWLRVTLAKHLFKHRYDYREEWLRFASTIGSGGENALPLGERAIQAVADVTDSPAGMLLMPGDHGELNLAARWNWPEPEVPAVAFPLSSLYFFERTGYVADLDELRGNPGSFPDDLAVPPWLLDESRAWALVPLIHFDRLVGMVVLARPHIVRPFDWEDFDLFRVLGRQLASYLAENSSQEALAEASRFEDFHRRIAFVMHDIKNLASQFSLLARNAELHADKPAFRADMIVTLRNSSEKLNALLARLSRYGNGAVDRLEEVRTSEVVAAVMQFFRDRPQVVLAESADLVVTANRHSLEQVLVHLVQNALDASRPDAPVMLSVRADGMMASFEVLDSGCGMSADFVRTRLFKPFVSTKSGGFGIGAFEARELVRAMRGRLDVESREGLGSRFAVRVPQTAAAEMYQSLTVSDQKVA
jgi:putative PEP-CTERM system histidine kinase